MRRTRFWKSLGREGALNITKRPVLLKEGAQDEERRRIARELHDSAGQTLAVLGMNLAQLVHRAESMAPALARETKEIEAVVQELVRQIRTTSYLLHPPLLDECGHQM
jgi:signal transduction histidine kinase